MKKQQKQLLIVCLLAFVAVTLLSAGSSLSVVEVYAVSGSPSDIQAAVDQVASQGGGTVKIPQGDFPFNWGSGNGVTVPGGVNIKGAGVGLTVLRQTENWPYTDWANNGYAFVIDGSNNGGKPTSILDFTFIGFRDSHPDADARVRCFSIKNVNGFRVGYVNVKDCGGGAVDVTNGAYPNIVCQGVIDHCYFYNTNGHPCGAGGIAYGPNVLGYGVGVYGAGDWISDTNQVLGKYDYGRPVTYIEDCHLSHWRHDFSANGGAHVVMRYSILDSDFGFGTLDVHGGGFGTGGVGTRASEVYGCTITDPSYAYMWNTGGTSKLFSWRGGAGVFFDNYVEDYNYMISFEQEGGDSTFYPKDVWTWDNTLVNCGPLTQGTCINYQATEKTGYTPYVYPHPLVTGESNGDGFVVPPAPESTGILFVDWWNGFVYWFRWILFGWIH